MVTTALIRRQRRRRRLRVKGDQKGLIRIEGVVEV